ncbi:hypothetical protein RHSIM_Rhsim01G0048000 [Rhododendron simsii]|uniref:Endonuclease/exonuclease/phosphatase domain-containing protein n=1 Tax=Rhododendron simsii TaxID=118357 RepID=A0A834M2D8_RHOSS|nr:hypothetical protein RHSIM_Rhsim01G0048000 [Rhododendron simsii]
MKTKNNKVLLETIRRRLDLDFGSYVDPIGLSEGLALWWKNEVEIDIETSTKNIVHTVISEKSTSHVWAASFTYGSPNREGRDQGPRFTWRNNRLGGDLIMERQDMAFANDKWRELYDQAIVLVEAAIGSDHNPLILNTSFPLKKVRKPFRFESFWTTEESCKLVIFESWDAFYEGFGLSKEKGVSGSNPDYMVEEKIIKNILGDLWQKDAMYWHQRSRIKWLQMGDKNSRFFHLSTIHRRQRNQIVKLKDVAGNWKMEEKDISAIIQTHFQELNSPPHLRDFGDIISLINLLVTPDINVSLTKPISTEQIRLATFQWDL